MNIDLEMQHRPRRKNIVADAFSRLLSELMNKTVLEDDLPDQYDEYVGAIINEAEEIGANTPHLEKTYHELIIEEAEHGPPVPTTVETSLYRRWTVQCRRMRRTDKMFFTR